MSGKIEGLLRFYSCLQAEAHLKHQTITPSLPLVKMHARLRDYVHLHFIVFLWGFTAILGLLIKLPPVELVFFRTLIAAAALGVLLLAGKGSFRIGLKETGQIMGVGFIICAHWLLFFGSARVSSASICLAGMATVTLWTALLEPVILRRSIKPHEVFLGLVILSGLYVIFRFEFDHALGLALSVASAMGGAIFSIINSQLTKKYAPLTITFYEMLGACLGTVLFFPFYQLFMSPTQELQLSPSLEDWLWIAILALVCTVYAFSASVHLMKRFSAYTMNLTVNLEPVYGIVLAVLIFGDKEKMSTGFYLGAAIILASVLSYPVLDKYITNRKAHLLKDPLPN
jgi:drug/metabolite transporter (DMT)-like permease